MGERTLITGRLVRNRNVVANCFYVIFIFSPMFILLYYLPIYFQSVKNVSAEQSGIRNVPLVLSISLFTILSGGLITIFGQFAYLMIIGSIFGSVGSGLIYTFDINTGTGKWIGYQIVVGVGIGLGLQIPIIVNQAAVEPSDLASASAFTLFVQTIGGAFWVSAAQAAFVSQLVQDLTRTAPNVNPAMVVATGATNIHKVFTPEQLPGILEAYMHGLRVTFLLALILSCIGVVVTIFPKWTNLKTKATSGGAA